jgi:hypothetical protein
MSSTINYSANPEPIPEMNLLLQGVRLSLGKGFPLVNTVLLFERDVSWRIDPPMCIKKS